MFDQSLRELRNIRITLIFLVIIVAFVSGNRTVTVDHFDDDQDTYPQFNYSNMVDLGDGDFGVLSGDAQMGEHTITIYHYDKSKNKLILKSENPLSDVH